MSLDWEFRTTAAKLLLEKSDRNMEQAVRNAEMDYWDLVSNRLYYSIFHAVSALLLIDGVKTGTHKGTSSQFGKYYVITGVFKREDGVLYSRLQTMREKADYDNVFTLSKEEGRKMMDKAGDLRKRICSVVEEKINMEI